MNTQFSAWLRAFALATISLCVVACGSDNTLSGGDGAPDPTNPDPTTPDPVDETTLRMGSLDPATGAFVQNVIAVGQSPIADGVGTTVRVDIVDEAGAPYIEDSLTVSFTAACADSAALPATRTTGASGSASSVYTGTVGCVGTDTITATATFGDQTLTATAAIEVRVVKLGQLNGSNFSEGVINIGQSPISTRGSSGLRVDLVDENDAPFTLDNFDVTFTSSVCADSAELDSPVTSVNGAAVSTFQDSGCARGSQITDTIRASASAYGKTLTAQGNLTIEPADLGALEFVSADPQIIGLKGTGGQGVQETSTVIFALKDSVGDPVVGVSVNFSLVPVDDTPATPRADGIELSDVEGITNSNGQVSVVVSSGSVHTTVRVRASATSEDGATTISSQSDQLVITSGIVDNDSFSLTAECFNLEAWQYDGVTTNVNIRLADRFNNPVPEGTAVAFSTEEGSIDGQCFTDTTGACSVEWRSQGRRPDDGRTTVVATANGEESFFDANGDGVHQAGEQDVGSQDLPEAYLDRDEDGRFDGPGEGFRPDPASEDNCEYDTTTTVGGCRQTENREITLIAADSNVDFNNNGLHDLSTADATGDNINTFTGLLCESGCDANANLLNVRESLTLIFSGTTPVQEGGFLFDDDDVNEGLLILDRSGDSPRAFVDNNNDGLNDYLFVGDSNVYGDVFALDNSMELGQKSGTYLPSNFVGSGSVGIILRDTRGQPMPAGTTVSVETDIGSATGITSYEWPCTVDDSLTSVGAYRSFSIKAPTGNQADSGAIRIITTTPRGESTVYSYGVSYTPAAAPRPVVTLNSGKELLLENAASPSDSQATVTVALSQTDPVLNEDGEPIRTDAGGNVVEMGGTENYYDVSVEITLSGTAIVQQDFDLNVPYVITGSGANTRAVVTLDFTDDEQRANDFVENFTISVLDDAATESLETLFVSITDVTTNQPTIDGTTYSSGQTLEEGEQENRFVIVDDEQSP